MAYAGRGSKTATKIINKDIKERGGRANASLGIAKEAAKIAAVIYGPNKAVKGVKAAFKGAKVAKDVVRGKRTYYHGSPNEIPVGSTLKTSRAKGASATNKKKLAKDYASKKLTLTPEGVKKSSTGGNVYKVKSQSGKVTQTGKFGKAKEYNAKDFVVVKKVKPKK